MIFTVSFTWSRDTVSEFVRPRILDNIKPRKLDQTYPC